MDTSILGRLANRTDTAHLIAVRAVAKLHRQGEVLHLTSQNLIEFRSFATRPCAVNGLGLPADAAEALEQTFESAFPLLEETAEIYPAWKSLVHTAGVIGKQVHDARLIAVCHVHGVKKLLSFNSSHFARLAGYGPGVVLIDPASA